jgi:hypothetical protein
LLLKHPVTAQIHVIAGNLSHWLRKIPQRHREPNE